MQVPNPDYQKKELNFVWLLNEYRSGSLPNTLNLIKKSEVADLLIELEYNLSQLRERFYQQIITQEKFDMISSELNKIREVFNQNLAKRVVRE